MRRSQARPRKELSATVVVEPPFPRLETRNDRVTGRLIVLRCVPARRAIAAADVAASGAAAKMQPPALCCQAFDAAGAARFSRRIDAVYLIVHGNLRALLNSPVADLSNLGPAGRTCLAYERA